MRNVPASLRAVLICMSLLAYGGCGSGTTTAVAPAVTLISAPLVSATVGVAYSATVVAGNGTQPYSFSIDSGLIPPGFVLFTNGVLNGTPTTPGTYTFTVSVSDSNKQRSSAFFTLIVVPSGPVAQLTLPTTSPASGTLGAAYSVAIAAAGGVAPYTFAMTAGTLPTGLALSTKGVLAGTPSAVGTFNFTVAVTDAISNHAGASYSVTIAPMTAVSLSTTTLPSGIAGTAYSTQITAANGLSPYTFSVTSGSLPSGITLATNGLLSGTSAAAGTSNFTVSVADASGGHASAPYSLTFVPALTITTASIPAGIVGSLYSTTFAASNGTAPYIYSLLSGVLPAGITLSTAGVLSGTPTVDGGAAFTIGVADSTTQHANATYNIIIAKALTVITPPLGPGQVGASYTAQFYAQYGTAPYTWALTAGALPGGFTFTSSGSLSGTATTQGTFNFTITATDATGSKASQAYSIVIAAAPPLTITTPPLGPAYLGNAYSADFFATNGNAPYLFAITQGALPAGMTFTPGGHLSGTPTAVGTANFTVAVTDASNAQASQAYVLTVKTGLGVVTNTLPNALFLTAYTTTLQIIGGVAPFTTTSSGGTLPPGITVSSAGVVSGTPTVAGTYSFNVTIVDSSTPQLSANVTLSLTVSSPVLANVQVDTTKILATVPQTAYGIHTSVYDSMLSDTAALPALLQLTGTQNLRYPGGSYADSYHWAQYSVTPIYASQNPSCGLIENGYLAVHSDFGNFVKTLQATNSQALITVNYGTSVANANATVSIGTDGQKTCSEPNTSGQAQEAAAWVAYANGDPANTQSIGLDAIGFDWKTVGFWATLRAAQPLAVDDGYNFLRIGRTAPVGVKNWEIGNEMYYNGWDSNRNFEDDLHAPFVYPNGYTPGGFNSRANVPQLSPTAYGTNAIAYIQAMKAVDPTIKIGVDFSSPQTDPIVLTWNPSLMQAVCAGANFDIAILHYYPGTYEDVQASEMLSLPQADMPRLVASLQTQLAQYCPANAANVQVFVTETGQNGTVDPSVPTAITGLYAMNIFLSALKSGIQNIDWLELHNGTFLDNSENPGPAFYGIQLAHDAAAAGDKMVSSSSDNSTVSAYATMKANGQKGLVLLNQNPSTPAQVTVTLTGATLGTTATQYSYGVSTTQSAPALAATTVAVSGNTFTVTVPAYTAVELLIP